MNAPNAKPPMIVAGSIATALQYAHQKGLRGPKVVTKISDFLDYDGSVIDVSGYQLFVVYGGIKADVMKRLQEMTAASRATFPINLFGSPAEVAARKSTADGREAMYRESGR